MLFITDLIYYFTIIAFGYFLIVNSFYALLVCFSMPAIIMRYRDLGMEDIYQLIKSESLPSLSIIVPCYNEASTIIHSIYGVLDLSYPSKEVIVVNDGSSDDSIGVMKEIFQLEATMPFFPDRIETKPIRNYYKSNLFPNLTVIDKENGGKGDALNAGINASSSSLFVVIDADTIVEKDAMLRMVRPFLTNERIIAQGATLRIMNDCVVERGKITKVFLPRTTLAGIQVVEYLKSFLFGRLGWNYIGGNVIIAGAFGMFLREPVVEAGGYAIDHYGEDLELTLRLIHVGRKKKRKPLVYFIPDPVAWTKAPSTMKTISFQRKRWHTGLVRSIIEHRGMFFNPKYGSSGMIGMPYLFFGELLQPILEVLCYVLIIVFLFMGRFAFTYFMLFLAVTVGYSMVLTFASVIMEYTTFRRYHGFDQLMRMLGLTVAENLGFRQLSALWKIEAFFKTIFSKTRKVIWR